MDQKKDSEPHTPGLANHPENSPILIQKGTLNQDKDILVCIGPDCQNDPDVKREQKELALNLVLLDKVDDALKIIDDSISKYPEDSVYYSLKGECLIKQWKYQEALEVLDKAIQLDDKNAVAHLNKGLALIQIEKYQLGIEEIDRSLTLNPKSVKALNTKGNALYEMDNLVEAILCWKRALEIDPQYDQAYNNIGIALDQQGKHKDSLIYFKKAIEISPNHPLYHCNMGIAQLSLDQDLALHDFKKAKRLLEDPVNVQQITKQNQVYIQERILMITELEEKKRKFKDLLKKLNVKKETYDDITATLLKVDNKAKTEYLTSMQDDKSDTIAQMQKQLEEIQKMLDKTGLTEKYKMKLALDEMEQNGGINGNLQKEYYCTFYWTLLEYLTAYQQLSLNVFKAGDAAYQFDKSKQDQSKQILIEMGAKYIGTQVKNFAEKIPIVGNIIGYLDEAVDKVFSIRKENIFLKKISAINDIIRYKKGETLAYEDLSLTLQSAAFQLCEKQKVNIVERVNSKQQHIGQQPESTEAWKVILNALNEFKDKILATNKTDMFQGEASAMALEDVLVVLVYFFDQYELIVNSTDTLSSIIVTLVITSKAKTYIIDKISKELPIVPIVPPINQDDKQILNENENCCALI